jgi:uncharacterized membrane protein YeaQ/YmgE (transglycosylase-associated protein family)
MIGMRFAPFLMLLGMGFVAALILHYVARYSVLKGVDGFIAKWIFGWIGAWLGTPIFGHWTGAVGYAYIIPALLGAFTLAFLPTAIVKAVARAIASTRPGAAVAPGTSEFEMRKVS